MFTLLLYIESLSHILVVVMVVVVVVMGSFAFVFLQGIRVKRLPWVSEQTLYFDFWAILELFRLQMALEMD